MLLAVLWREPGGNQPVSAQQSVRNWGLPASMLVSSEVDSPPLLRLNVTAAPPDSSAAISWEVLIYNLLAKMVPDFWPSETMPDNACFKLLSLESLVMQQYIVYWTKMLAWSSREISSLEQVSCEAMREWVLHTLCLRPELPTVFLGPNPECLYLKRYK